jgi:hypothetical protein
VHRRDPGDRGELTSALRAPFDGHHRSKTVLLMPVYALVSNSRWPGEATANDRELALGPVCAEEFRKQGPC